MPHLMPTLAATVAIGLSVVACSKPQQDTSFARAKKGFEQELTTQQRKAAIKALQTETAGKP